MKRFFALALIGALALGVSSVVYANVCAFDPVPAASLLFPFVAYDYDGGFSGDTTIFSITNVSAEAQIVHVTLWTDYSVPVLDFNLLLTGYDVQRINIRDILANGQLPVTLLEHHNTGEGVFDNGPVSSQNNINDNWVGDAPWALDEPEETLDLGSDRCSTSSQAYPGRYADEPISPFYLQLFKASLQASQTGTWYHSDDCQRDFPDRYTLQPAAWMYLRDETDPTWMYITADVVQTCNLTFPDNPSYWIPYTEQGEARYDNVLIGDVTWLSNTDRLSEMNNAVHIEADLDLGRVATINPETDLPISFYGRYANFPTLRSDYREPLPTAWAFRYQGYNVDGLDTLIRAWKGGTNLKTIYDLYFAPDTGPTTFVASNCNAYTYYAWDEEENVLVTTTLPWSGGDSSSVVPNLLPLETQEVSIDQFDLVDDFGWLLFVWPASNYDTINNPIFPDFYQTWMGAKYVKTGDYSAAIDGVVMANFNCFSDQVIPNLGINYNYVNQGGYVTSPSIFE